MKKQTYQELERRNYLLIIFIIGIIITFYFYNDISLRNDELKSQLNSTEGKNYSCDFVGAIKPEDNRVCEDETICSDTYLGFCFNKSSAFYKSDLINEECNEENFEIVSTIKFMEENNIKMYVSSTCPACKQQLQQFRDYQFALATKKLVIFCDMVKDIGCKDVVFVPTWKQNGKIINMGVMEIGGLKNL
jgi:hypothetical protein